MPKYQKTNDTLVTKREAKRLEREAEAALVREKKIKQILVQGSAIEEFWHESLNSKATMEEVLNIKPLKPMTARNALGIDVYEAKGLTNRFKIKTIGEFFKLFTNALQAGPGSTQTFKEKISVSCTNPHKTEQILAKFQSLMWVKDLGRWAPPGEETETKAKKNFLHFRHKLKIREREMKYKRGGDKAPPKPKPKSIPATTTTVATTLSATTSSSSTTAMSSSSTNTTTTTMNQTAPASLLSNMNQSLTPLLKHNRLIDDDLDVDKDDVGVLGISKYGSLDDLLSSSPIVKSAPIVVKRNSKQNRKQCMESQWDNSTSVVNIKEEPFEYDGWQRALVQEAQMLRTGQQRNQPKLRRKPMSKSTSSLSRKSNKRKNFGNKKDASDSEFILPTPISTLKQSARRTPLERTLLNHYDPAPSYLSLQPLEDLRTNIYDTFDGSLEPFEELSDDEGISRDVMDDMMNRATYQRNIEDQQRTRTASNRSSKVHGSLDLDLMDRRRAREWVKGNAKDDLAKRRPKTTSHLGNYISEGTRYSVLRGVLRKTGGGTTMPAAEENNEEHDAWANQNIEHQSHQEHREHREHREQVLHEESSMISLASAGSLDSLGSLGSLGSLDGGGSTDMLYNDGGGSQVWNDEEQQRQERQLRKQEHDMKRTRAVVANYIKAAQKHRIPLPQALIRLIARRDVARDKRPPLLAVKSALDDHTRKKFQPTKTKLQLQQEKKHQESGDDGTIDLSNISTDFDTFAGSISSALSAAQMHSNDNTSQEEQSTAPLEGLVCRQNGLTADGAYRLLSAGEGGSGGVQVLRGNANKRRGGTIEQSTQWSSLDLSSNRIGLPGGVFKSSMGALGSSALPSKYRIRKPSSLGSPQMLCIALRSQLRLQTLNLAENQIKDNVAVLLADGLFSLPFLSHLELGNNEIGDKGAAAFGSLIACTKTIHYCGMSWQKVSASGASCFMAGVAANQTLTTLAVAGWPLGSKAISSNIPTPKYKTNTKNKSSSGALLSTKQLVARLIKRAIKVTTTSRGTNNQEEDEKVMATKPSVAPVVEHNNKGKKKRKKKGKKKGGGTTKGQKGNSLAAQLAAVETSMVVVSKPKPSPTKKKRKKPQTMVELMHPLMEKIHVKPPYEMLAEVFARCSRLIHLDCSYARLDTPNVHAALSKGLSNNHTLYGLHLDGNYIRIDPRGFLQIGGATMPHTMSLSDLSCGTLQSGHEISGDVSKHGHDNRCWICEEWCPHTFVANKKERKIGVLTSKSGEEGKEDLKDVPPPPPLVLTLNFEKWMTFPLRAPEGSACNGAAPNSSMYQYEEQRIELMRMCPPGTVRSMVRRATLDEEYRNVMGSSSTAPTTKDYGMRHVHTQRVTQLAVPFYHPDYNINELPMTCRPRTLLPDGRLKGDPDWKPRTVEGRGKGGHDKNKYGKAPDAPEVALFLGLREDYARTKAARFLKKKEDHLAVLLELIPHAVLLRELFQFYAFQGDGGDAFTISLNEITQFANDFELFDRTKHVYGLAQLDLAFTACNVEIKGAEGNDENPNRELQRYEFIEMLVRIALSKYSVSMKHSNPNDKVRTLLDDHIVKFAYSKIAQADGVDETRELINQHSDALHTLDEIYGFRLEDLFVYSCRLNDNKQKKGRKKKKDESGLEIDGFFELLSVAGIVDDQLTGLEIRQSFVDSQDDSVLGDNKVAGKCRRGCCVWFKVQGLVLAFY